VCSQFCDVFRCLLHFICWMSAIFLLPVCLTYWPRKYTTRVATHVDNCHQLKTLCLSVLESWVITFPIGYHWKCIQGHCACAESRDPWVGGQKQLHFWNPRPRFAYSLYNFHWATTTIKGRLLSSNALDCVNFLCVTLWPWPLTSNSCRTWRVTWLTLPPNLKTLRLFVHELRVITVPTD